jgi:excinuclease UvrABC nuclease subunit
VAELGTILLTGKSGSQYLFWIYSLDTNFKNEGAVYVYTQATPNSEGGHTHSVIYVGQTGDLGSRLSNHHKWACINGRGANRICTTRIMPNEQERLNMEADLIAYYRPVCNELLKSTPERFRF